MRARPLHLVRVCVRGVARYFPAPMIKAAPPTMTDAQIDTSEAKVNTVKPETGTQNSKPNDTNHAVELDVTDSVKPRWRGVKGLDPEFDSIKGT